MTRYLNTLNSLINNNWQWTATETHSSFPHYNIIRINEQEHKIELALAGYSKNDFVVKLLDDKLTIESVKKNENAETKLPEYLHKGIAHRHFKLVFTIPKDSTVEKPQFENGILSIDIIQKVKVSPTEKILSF